MAKLLVMTDLHLVAPGGRIIGIDPLDRCKQGLAHAEKNHSDADRLIVMGDLTNAGEPAAYEALRVALEDRPWPVTLMMGNHDDRHAFRSEFPNHSVDPNGFIQNVIDHDVRIITLDSLVDAPNPPESGALCGKRLDWLSGALNTDLPCLVFVHHPPFDTGFAGMDRISLQERDAFWAELHGSKVAHVFAGHVHRTITASVAGHSVTIFKSTCHQMPMLLGKEGFGHSVDEPGAYGIISTNGEDVVVHFEDFTLPAQTVSQFDQ